MSRQRDLYEGIFHVTCHSVWDGALFRDDLDRTNYVHELARITSSTSWELIAACLMTTHAHLVVGVRDDQLAEAMQALNFRYAARFNSRHRRRGRVFGAPYGSHRIHDDDHLLTVYRYVVLNPVEAGLVRSPQEWIYSSYGSVIGARPGFDFVNANRVLGCFHRERDVAMGGLRRFVETS